MTTTEADPREDLLEAALSEGLSYAKAAETAGVSKSTVERRMRDAEFRARVMAGREERAAEAASRIDGLAVRAVERLSDLIDAEGIIGLKAALSVLSSAEQRRQARETGDRLGRLERAVEALVEQRGLRSAA